jgi:hypothetical protein
MNRSYCSASLERGDRGYILSVSRFRGEPSSDLVGRRCDYPNRPVQIFGDTKGFAINIAPYKSAPANHMSSAQPTTTCWHSAAV